MSKEITTDPDPEFTKALTNMQLKTHGILNLLILLTKSSHLFNKCLLTANNVPSVVWATGGYGNEHNLKSSCLVELSV